MHGGTRRKDALLSYRPCQGDGIVAQLMRLVNVCALTGCNGAAGLPATIVLVAATGNSGRPAVVAAAVSLEYEGVREQPEQRPGVAVEAVAGGVAGAQHD